MNSLQKKIFSAFVLIGAIIFCAGCAKEYLDMSNISDEIQVDNWEGVIPLAYANFTLADVLKKSGQDDFIRTYDDNLLYMIFEEHTISQTADKIVEIDDQSFSQSVAGTAFSPGVNHVSQTFNFNIMAFDRPRAFEEIRLKSGILNLHVRSEYQKTGRIILRFQVEKPNGQMLSDTFFVTDATGTFNESKNINLAGHTILAGNSPNLDTTYFRFTIEAFIDDAATPPGAGEELSVDINISNLDYSFVRGFFGQDTIMLDQKDLIGVDMMTDEASGSFNFLNPQLRVYVSNSFGIPITLRADSLFASLKEPVGIDSIKQLLFTPGNTSQFQVNIPNYMADNAGLSKDTIINIGENIENLDVVVNEQPDDLWYNLSTFTNMGITPGPNDLNQYITDTSNIKLRVAMELPIDGYTEGYLFNDTMDANLQDILDASVFVDELKIQIQITNGLPIDIEVQGVWLDSNYNEIDSLHAEGITTLAKSATTITDAYEPTAYRASRATQHTTTFSFKGGDIEKLSKARHLLITAVAITWNGSSGERIKIYADDTFFIKVGAELKLSGNSRDIEKLSK